MTTTLPRPLGTLRRRAGGQRLDGLSQWLVTRVAVALLAFAGSWTVLDNTGVLPSYLSVWNRWDVGLFIKIARWGYQGYPRHYPDRGIVAFFPGEPLLLRVVHYVVPDWVLAGLLISAVSGAVGCLALARIAALDGGGPPAANRAVWYLLLSPYAVFLAAGYSEALFLACALPAWYAARTGRWRAAGILAGLAAAVRITGLALALALVVERLVRGRSAGRWADFGWLLLPFAVVAGYFGYLYALTGDWLAWPHAQRVGWGRQLVNPWHALVATWNAAHGTGQGTAYIWSFRAEIAAVAVGVALTGWLLARRDWAEACYVGVQVAAFASSSFYLSVGRGSLLWWPLWVLLARAALRRRWLHSAYLALAPPLMAVLVLAFTSGHWVG